MKQKIIFGFVFYALTQTAFSAELTASSPAEAVKVEAPVVAEKAQEKFVAIEKRIDLPGIVLNEKLNESIGIETLADVVTPLISKGSSLPSTTTVKLGVSKDCACAKIRLFRSVEDVGKPPVKIIDDAIVGFSSNQKVIEVILETTADAHLNLKVQLNSSEKAKLRWLTVKELKAEQAQAGKKAARKVKKAKSVTKSKTKKSTLAKPLNSKKSVKSKKAVIKKKSTVKPATKPKPVVLH